MHILLFLPIYKMMCLIARGELWLAKENVKMLREWWWERNRKWKIIFPCFSTSPCVLGLFYDAVLLHRFFSCLLLISQWGCLNTLPDKSNCPNLFKRPSETYGANQNHGQQTTALKSCAPDFHGNGDPITLQHPRTKNSDFWRTGVWNTSW